MAQLTTSDIEALDIIHSMRQIEGDRVQQVLAHLRNMRVIDQLKSARRREMRAARTRSTGPDLGPWIPETVVGH